MLNSSAIWPTISDHIARQDLCGPVMYFCANELRKTARTFQDGFGGLVTYAVKANPHDVVLQNLTAVGIVAFDVASVAEIETVRRHAPSATMHFNNPVRSRDEIRAASEAGVCSYSVDCQSELSKLIELVPAQSVEISVRFTLPIKGGAYDFGSKFGATPKDAIALLKRVAAAGYQTALAFHPGTQCHEPHAWGRYISAAADIAKEAGVNLERLNVGGGFPSQRNSNAPVSLSAIFAEIAQATKAAFGPNPPKLLCEPGRAMVAESFSLCTTIRAVRDDGALFLNDGMYGCLSEQLVMGATDRVRAMDEKGQPIEGARKPATLFGPTCDSLDKFPDGVCLPQNLKEGQHIIFAGMGAYSLPLTTGFNGFGRCQIVNVLSLI